MLSKFLPAKRSESHPTVDHHLTQQILMKKGEIVEHLQPLLQEGLQLKQSERALSKIPSPSL